MGAQVRGAQEFSHFQLHPGPRPALSSPLPAPPPPVPDRPPASSPSTSHRRILNGGCPAEGLRGTLPPKGGVGGPRVGAQPEGGVESQASQAAPPPHCGLCPQARAEPQGGGVGGARLGQLSDSHATATSSAPSGFLEERGA